MTAVAEDIAPTTFGDRFLAITGIDRAIGWTAAARVWSVVAGPITLVLVATHLTPDEQGFYYTFSSILALQVIFELGLGYVVQQFASHEKAFLQWRPDGTLEGVDRHKERLGAVIRKTLRWYGIASVLMTISLLIGGTFFFASKTTSVAGWQRPWITMTILAGVTLLLTPLTAVLEGCGAVADVARIRTWMVVASNLAIWTVLLSGGRLWASPSVFAASLFVGATWLFARHRHFFLDLARAKGEDISWREEVWPFQWRIAVSWVSGYFIFQLFVPVLFRSQGPAAAGRMGMSIAVVTAMLTVSMSWLTTKMPAFGELIARRDFAALDARFFPAVWRSFAVMAFGCAVFFAGAMVLHSIGHRWSQRILDPLPLALLIATMLVNHIVFAEGVYLRAHKQEPFLWISVLSALAIGTATFTLGRIWGATGMMLGFFVATVVVSLGGGTRIFVHKRREWHA